MNRYSIIIGLAAAFAVALTGSAQTTDTTQVTSVTTGLDEDGLPPRIDYAGNLSHSCVGARAVDVVPDTEQARTAADRWCLRAELVLDRVDWPGDFRPADVGHSR